MATHKFTGTVPFKYFTSFWDKHQKTADETKNERSFLGSEHKPKPESNPERIQSFIRKKRDHAGKRYEDLPTRNNKLEHRLYYLNKRNLLDIHYFQDELKILSHMQSQCPSLIHLCERTSLTQQMGKQLSFLKIQKEIIIADLQKYHQLLKEAAGHFSKSKYSELKQEQARINGELEEFLSFFTYTKHLWYELCKELLPLRKTPKSPLKPNG